MNEDMLTAAMAPPPPLMTTYAAPITTDVLHMDTTANIQQTTGQLQPATGSVLSPPSLIEGGPSGDFHRIQMILDQQPDRGKATSSTDRVQHFLDPPPVIRLELLQKEGAPVEDLAILTSPYLICVVHLEAPSETLAHTAKCGIKNVKERFWGGLASWVTRVNNPEHHPTLPTAYMVWPTLMVKEAGTYRLHFELYMMSPQHTKCTLITVTDSEPFSVHGHRGFPGYGPSTDLTMRLYHAKVKLKVRPESKSPKKQKVAHQDQDSLGTGNHVDEAQNTPMPAPTPVAVSAFAPTPRSRAKKPRQNKPSNGLVESSFAFPGQGQNLVLEGLNNNGFMPTVSHSLPSTGVIPMDGFATQHGATGLPYTADFGSNHNMWDGRAVNNTNAGISYGMAGPSNNVIHGSAAGVYQGFGPGPSDMIDCSAALAPGNSKVATRRPKAYSNPQRIPTPGSRPITPRQTLLNTNQIKTEYPTTAAGVSAAARQLSSTSMPPTTMPFQPGANIAHPFNFTGAQGLPLDHINNSPFDFSQSAPVYQSGLAMGMQSNPSIFPSLDDNDMSTDASDNDLGSGVLYGSVEWNMPHDDMSSQMQNDSSSQPLSDDQMEHLTMGQDTTILIKSTEVEDNWFDGLPPPSDSQNAALQLLSITPPERTTPNTPTRGSATQSSQDGANQIHSKQQPPSNSCTITPEDEAGAAAFNMLAAYSQ